MSVCGHSVTMDDFDYSVQISERDWDIFFQDCEECDLLPPALAGADDSGVSDADDTASTSVLPRGSRVAEERDSPAIDEPPDRAGLPVERYLSACDLPRPEDVLSCSEEDSHLESINVFFERLRVTEGGGSFLVEARPKGTWQEVCALEEPSKKPAGLAQSQSYSNQRLTAKEDKVGGTLSTGRGGKDFDRAGKSIETESEEDEAFGPCEPTVELFIREEEWAVDEEWKQEKEGELSKDKLLKAAPLGKTPSDDECGLGRKQTEVELQTSRLKNTDGTEHRPREGEMTSQAFLREAISLYGQQMDLQTDPEALLCMGTAAGAENHTVKSAKKQKEHWFVPMEVAQDSSRADISPSVRKKRKQIRDSPDPLVAGQGFEGLGGISESETQVERFEREAAGQGEVASGRDGKTCVGEAGIKHKSFSAHRMTQSSGTVPRSSELLSLVHNVKECGVESHTAERNHTFKESVTRLEEYNREDIPNLSNQQQYGLRHDLQNRSQHICIPVNNTEILNLSVCEQSDNSPESLQSGDVMIQHDPVSPQCSGLSVPETRNDSEQFLPKEPDGFNISDERFPDKKLLENKPTLQINSPDDDKAVCRFSNVFLPISSSTESPQCNRPFVSDLCTSEDSRKQDIPEHEHGVPHGQNFPMFSQEENRNAIRSPEISPSKEPSLSLNNIGGHRPSWTLDPVDVQRPKSEEVESPPEYQEVEEYNDGPIHMSNDETTHQRQAKTDIGNIVANTSYSASEIDKPSTVTSDETLVLQAPKPPDKETLVRSDLVAAPATPDTHNAAISLCTNLTESSVASDDNESSIKTIALPESDSDKGSQTDDWQSVKGEDLPQTSTVECAKKSLQAPIDVSAVHEVETVFEPELQNNTSVDIPVLRTSEDKAGSSAEGELSLHPESTDTKPLETKYPDHTMSTFWKEMEKLTINDILHLRSVGNAQDPRGLPRDSGLMEASEAGDSGYSSHLEDSKLDQSSADVSTMSDFEEQCSLAHSAASVESSLEPRDTKTQGQRSPNSRGVMWESELDPAGPGMNNDTNEMPTLYSGDSISPLLLSDKAQQGFRRMCKNISVQNLQALEVEPPVNQVTSTSLVTAATEEKELYESSSSFQRPEENPSSVPLESDGRTSAVSSLSGGDVRERHRTSFREIIKYLFGVGEPGVGQEDTTHTEEPAGDGGSVAEMYDYFFSDFETGNFFLPLSQAMGNGKNEPVPVTSSSRYSNRNLQFPEAYDYFFPDDSSIESEDKGDGDHNQAPVRVVTCLNKDTREPLGAVTTPDMYEHFFTNSDWRESLFWRNPLSLRRMRFKGLTGPREGSTSCVVVTAERQGRSVLSTICTESSVDFHGAVSPQTPLYCLEEQIFRERQRQYTDLQTAIAVPNSSLLSLRQSDMCLMCIAFASWVLKTANPQDSDTWKAALLANISALSAIRYLRRYVREEGDEP